MVIACLPAHGAGELDGCVALRVGLGWSAVVHQRNPDGHGAVVDVKGLAGASERHGMGRGKLCLLGRDMSILVNLDRGNYQAIGHWWAVEVLADWDPQSDYQVTRQKRA